MVTHIILAGLIGLSIGSFLNVVILRLPDTITGNDINLNNPKRSFCPICKHTLGVFELIPVFSFLFQKGKCKHCYVAINWQYPIVESVSALISGAIVAILGVTIEAGFYLLLSYFLLPLLIIDAKRQLLPDALTLPLIWMGFIYQINSGNLQDGVVGAMLGYVALWLISTLFQFFRKKESIGYGDMKLFAAFGAWIGWYFLPVILLGASILSLVYVLLLRVGSNQRFAFGPFLMVSFVCVFIFNTV